MTVIQFVIDTYRAYVLIPVVPLKHFVRKFRLSVRDIVPIDSYYYLFSGSSICDADNANKAYGQRWDPSSPAKSYTAQ